MPAAATVNDTACPASTVWSVGCSPKLGLTPLAVTVTVALVLVAFPARFVATQRKTVPLSARVSGTVVNVPPFAPKISAKLTAPGACTCHCNAGVGTPVAAAVNVAACVSLTVAFRGCTTNCGAASGRPAT